MCLAWQAAQKSQKTNLIVETASATRPQQRLRVGAAMLLDCSNTLPGSERMWKFTPVSHEVWDLCLEISRGPLWDPNGRVSFHSMGTWKVGMFREDKMGDQLAPEILVRN